MKKRIIVGISGASGAPLAIALLKALRDFPEVESHLVITPAGMQTMEYEVGCGREELSALADEIYNIHAIGASIASGTFRTDGMVVIPCSMKTVAGIASGYSDNLLLRAADVVLKERRKLVLVVRESPFSSIHLRNMLELSQVGAVIFPSMLSYYSKPQTIADVEKQLIGKVLDQFGLDYSKIMRWTEGENG